ncbi:MAG: dihydrodipicolinate synthase family protein [Candidatus Neomarinimicrobiota bacterium]
MLDLKGIFPAVSTPFEGSAFAPDHLRFNLEHWNKTNIRGYVVLGSTGESVSLTEDEKLSVLQSVDNFRSKDKILIVGAGTDSLPGTESLIERAAEHGADAALVITPYYYRKKTNHSGIVEYYRQIADTAKIPVIVYNVPLYTDVCLEPEIIAELSQHANIIGIKNSVSDLDHLKAICDLVDRSFQVLTGNGSQLKDALELGAVGGILAIANIAPEIACEIVSQWYTDNGNLVEDQQSLLKELNDIIVNKFGVSGVKTALDMIGLYGGEVRLPLTGLSASEIEELSTILNKAKLIK